MADSVHVEPERFPPDQARLRRRLLCENVVKAGGAYRGVVRAFIPVLAYGFAYSISRLVLSGFVVGELYRFLVAAVIWGSFLASLATYRPRARRVSKFTANLSLQSLQKQRLKRRRRRRACRLAIWLIFILLVTLSWHEMSRLMEHLLLRLSVLTNLGAALLFASGIRASVAYGLRCRTCGGKVWAAMRACPHCGQDLTSVYAMGLDKVIRSHRGYAIAGLVVGGVSIALRIVETLMRA